MNQSTLAAIGATSLALLATLLMYTVSGAATWLAGAGALLVGVGVFAGTRGPVGVGVGLLAIASLVATWDEALGLTLGLSAVVAVLCIATLLIADLSFAMRRDTVVSPSTLQGLFGVHAVATALGIGLATLLVAAVVAVSWPGWLLLLPAVVLGGAAAVMARQANRYHNKLRTVAAPAGARPMPPPPPAGIRSTMPPPPAPDARPTGQVPPPPLARGSQG